MFDVGVDRHGDKRHVNEVHAPSADEEDESRTYYDEEGQVRSLFSGLAAQEYLVLKKGARVLATQKIQNIVSVGSIGTVVGFREADAAVQDNMVSEYEIGYGMDRASVQLDWGDVHKNREWPCVEFEQQGAKMLITVPPLLHTVEDNNGVVLCSRIQVPLILAYAMTIHRAQGQTLDAMIFSMKDVFAFGQIYTALGRVKNFSRVRITGSITSSAKLCDSKVVDFELSTVWTGIDNKPD